MLADVVLVDISGRIDHTNAEAFRTALSPWLEQCTATGSRLVLNFGALQYISSAGLRVIMLAAKQAKAQSGFVAVAAMQPVVREIFEISRFHLVVPCFDQVRDAVSALSPQAGALLEST